MSEDMRYLIYIVIGALLVAINLAAIAILASIIVPLIKDDVAGIASYIVLSVVASVVGAVAIVNVLDRIKIWATRR